MATKMTMLPGGEKILVSATISNPGENWSEEVKYTISFEGATDAEIKTFAAQSLVIKIAGKYRKNRTATKNLNNEVLTIRDIVSTSISNVLTPEFVEGAFWKQTEVKPLDKLEEEYERMKALIEARKQAEKEAQEVQQAEAEGNPQE